MDGDRLESFYYNDQSFEGNRDWSKHQDQTKASESQDHNLQTSNGDATKTEWLSNPQLKILIKYYI